MYSQEDLKSLHGFLKSTNEGGLKKMLVGGRMSEVHLRLLLKIVRGVGEDEFVKILESESFPKIKLGAPEIAIKEGFWGICLEACVKVGLINASSQAKAA